jgi:hypothetical protein
VGPRLFFSFLIYSIHNRQGSLNEWSAHRKASTETLDGKWPIILLRGPLGAWGSLTCSKFTTRVKQLKNSTTSAGFEPASLESWGGNATSRLILQHTYINPARATLSVADTDIIFRLMCRGGGNTGASLNCIWHEIRVSFLSTVSVQEAVRSNKYSGSHERV